MSREFSLYLVFLIVSGVFWLTDRISKSRKLTLAVLEQLDEMSGRLDELEEKIDSLR
jgi:hypothetical protein